MSRCYVPNNLTVLVTQSPQSLNLGSRMMISSCLQLKRFLNDLLADNSKTPPVPWYKNPFSPMSRVIAALMEYALSCTSDEMQCMVYVAKNCVQFDIARSLVSAFACFISLGKWRTRLCDTTKLLLLGLQILGRQSLPMKWHLRKTVVKRSIKHHGH
jgi:hypothetical protein